jgi:hypothetical protein
MFRRLLRPLWHKLTSPRAFLTTSAILTYTLLKTHPRLDSSSEDSPEDRKAMAQNL